MGYEINGPRYKISAFADAPTSILIGTLKELLTEEEGMKSKKDVRDPCAVCGWGRHMGIHQPALTGSRKGLPWGHEFVPVSSRS